MQTTSALYKRILAEDHWFETKLVIDGVGTFTERQLFSISTQLHMFQGSPTLGAAVAGEISVQMLAPEESIPVMATLRPYVRARGKIRVPSDVSVVDDIITLESGAEIANDVLTLSASIARILTNDYLGFVTDQYEDATSEWLPQGVYIVDTRERSINESGLPVLTLHGFDAMLKTEQAFESSTITGDSTDTQMVAEIASIIGVEVDERTYALMDKAYTIPLPTGYTLREVLGYIASMYVGCFIMSEDGKLRLVSMLELPPETNYLIDQEGDMITFGGDRILV